MPSRRIFFPSPAIAFFSFLALSGFGSSPASGGEPIPLWPGGAPYAHGEEATDIPVVIPYAAPEDTRNGCAVVVCPGGGYGGLARDHEGHQIAQFYNDFGVTAFVLHYRLGTSDYHYPTQLADVQRALRWARANAKEYEIDPGRLGVMGFSAGGHLASMAATMFDTKAYQPGDPIDEQSARPDFAVLCYPVISLSTEHGHSGSRNNLLGRKDIDLHSQEVRSVSTELNVTAETPPTFLFHTTEDTVVPVQNSLLFFDALQKFKIPSELHVYQTGPHGVGLYRGSPTTGTWSGLLKGWMRNSGFLATAERVALSGTVTLDGEPVSWGVIALHPEDPDLPIATARIRNGKFSATQPEGPTAGRHRVVVEASIWEGTQNPQDRVITIEKLSPGDTDAIYLEIGPDQPALTLDLKSR